MIIKPYLTWPKVSKLRIGDRIRWTDAEIRWRELNPEYHHIVIEEMHQDPFKDDKEHMLINGWCAHRFEVKME